jgi:hypothetical protein
MGRTVNTMQEAMQDLLHSLTDMKGFPDADLPWIIGIETQIIQKIQERYGASNQVGTPPPGNAQPAPTDPTMPTGMGGGGPMMGPNSGSGMGTRGMQMGPAAPNVDELRRLVGGGGVQGG